MRHKGLKMRHVDSGVAWVARLRVSGTESSLGRSRGGPLSLVFSLLLAAKYLKVRGWSLHDRCTPK